MPTPFNLAGRVSGGLRDIGATVFSHIWIHRIRIPVFVNPAKRTEVIKTEISKCLGFGACLRIDKIRDTEALGDQSREG